MIKLRALKGIVATIAMTAVILSTMVFSFARVDTTTLKGDNVSYDNINHMYCLSLVDNQGESWVIELFNSRRLSLKTLDSLNVMFAGKEIEAEFESFDNSNLYDDAITKWQLK